MPLTSGDQKGLLRTAIFFVIVCVNTAQKVPLRVSPVSGNLQILDQNVWKNLQSRNLEIPDLKVLCRSLGLPTDDVSRLNNAPQTTGGAVGTTISVALDCIGNETNINECQTTFSQFPDVRDKPITLECKALTFHLYGGSPTDGLVMVTVGNETMPVCADQLVDGVMAGLLCKRMGLNWSFPLVIYPYKYTQKSVKRALKLEVTCSGNDTDCELQTTYKNDMCHNTVGISYIQIAAVFCSDKAPEYRLATFPGESIPRLDVKVNDTWGPVCAEAGNVQLAEAVCRKQGLPSTNVRYYSDLYSGGDFEPGYLEMNFCTSENGYIGNTCQYSQFGKPCKGQAYLGVACDSATEGQVRVWSSSSFGGTVQVYHNGTWRAVAVNSAKTTFLQEATVACRSANLPTNAVRVKGGPFRFNHSVWLNDLDCLGNETSLLDCSDTPLDQINSTTLGVPLVVQCGAGDEAIRLEDDGLLMMRRNGRWGTVCAGGFGNLEAAVVCKSLNKSSSLAWVSKGSNTPPRNGTIWRESFSCNTIGDDWRKCLGETNYWRDSCTHEDDAYITCKSLDRDSVIYRLAKSPVPYAGFVEMRINNTWGGVCDRQFGSSEAQVVCRTLGMRSDGARVFYSEILTSSAINKVWLSRINCTGSEASILDCQHSYFGDGRCTNWRGPAAVWCGSPNATEDFQIRLVGESDSEPSRVEVSLFGEWGTICDKNFDDNAAETVCRQLGLPSILAKVADKGTYETGAGRIWLTNTTCHGYESRLRRCSPALAGDSCDHTHDVGVVCKGFTTVAPYINTFSYSGVPTGVILGATFGAAGFVFIVGLVLVLIRTRLISTAQPVAARPAVQYVVPTNNGVVQANSYPPPYTGYVPQYATPTDTKQ